MRKRQLGELKSFLDQKVDQYNHPSFIANDPISVPHQFSVKQDIEIAGFFASVLAWGQRKTIVRKANELMELMDQAPYQFVRQHSERDLLRLSQFRHRTFNGTDTLYFIYFLRHYYQSHASLEDAFFPGGSFNAETSLSHFHHSFFNLPEAPPRTRKHVSTPERGSACKRLNMFLRWMVRNDGKGVDFGIWNRISPRDLVCPCDLHVERVARQFKLISRKSMDWLTAIELTDNLKRLDPDDPVKYDFALFGLGIDGSL